jgi:DNA-binding XRE family transcriptional regulator
MFQQQLLAKQSKNDKDIAIGNGYSVEWVAAKLVRVYRYGVPFKVVEIKAGIDRRRLVIELVLEGGIIKSRLAKALKISRQSIDTWIDTFKKSGFEGLVNSYKGDIRTGRVENSGKLPIGNKARQLEEARRLKREEIQEQQLIINFDSAKSQSEILVNSQRLSTEQSSEAQNSDEKQSGEDDKQLVVVENTEEKDSSKISEPQIANLFEDSYDFRENRYAGSFVYWAIFQHVFNLMGLCDTTLRHYSIVIYLFAMMLINDIASIEQLKTVFRREFGNLIGIKQLWSKPNIWKLIHNLCHLGRSRQLIEDFFNFQAKRSLVALYWLYIDGHFVPYYGKERIHSGFYTQRDQMMPGQTEMYVHDCQGQIVYFEIQEGKGDLKEMMRRMSEKWSAYIGDTPPLIIADREAWGVENFLQMRGYRFVTWEKFSKAEELSSITDDKFGAEFQVNSKMYQVFEDKKTYRDDKGNRIELRRIIIWNKKTNKRVACVCQDEQEDAITIATAMLGRWGSSENSFKHMGSRFNMPYNPVVDTSTESESQDIVNPKFKQIKKEISRLRKLLAKCERQLARLPITQKKDGSLRKSNKREKLQKELKELRNKIAEKQEELANCPERVDINEVKPDASFKVLSTEGKNLWNLTEALVWNSRKKLVQLFRNYLPNERDLIPVLDAITKSRGWIRSTKEVIEIRLEPLETKRFEAAQIQLCRYFNEKEIRLANGKRLLYDVGPDPTKTVQ